MKNSTHINNLRIIEEKTNIGILPPLDIDRVTAVTNLINQYHLKGFVFIGDDIVDVPAFRVVRLARQNLDLCRLATLVSGKGTREKILDKADFTVNEVRETYTCSNGL